MPRDHVLSCSPQYVLLAHCILGFSRDASICQHWLTFWLGSSDTEWEMPVPTRKLTTLPTQGREALGWGLQKSPAVSSEARAAYQEHSPRSCTFYKPSHAPSRPLWIRSLKWRELTGSHNPGFCFLQRESETKLSKLIQIERTQFTEKWFLNFTEFITQPF